MKMKRVNFLVIVGLAIHFFSMSAMESPISKQNLLVEEGKESVEAWVDEDRNRIDQPDKVGGRTLLYYAVSKDKPAIVDYLIKSGANPNIVYKKEGATPFLIAVKRGKAAFVKQLLKTADLRIRTNKGENVLHLAVEADPIGGPDIIAMLAERRPIEIAGIVNQKMHKDHLPEQGLTPLQLALEKRAIRSIKELIKIQGIHIEPHQQEEIDKLKLLN